MAEEGEGGEVVSFIAEQFKRLNVRLDGFEARADERMGRFESRMDRLEDRMAQLERRQTAFMQFQQSMVTHLAAIHEGQDSVKAQFVGVDRRIETLEAR